MQMKLQAGAVDTQADGQDDAWRNRVCQSVFCMPGAAASTSDLQRDLVVEGTPPQLRADDADPGSQSEECQL